MSDGNGLLSDIERLLSDDNELPTRVSNALIFGALRHVYGAVRETTEQLEHSIAQNTASIRAHSERIAELSRVDTETRGELKRTVSWEWVRDNMIQPVMIALAMWLLLTFIPANIP